MDEGDFRFSDESTEIIKILNNGNARGFPVLRSESVSGKEFDRRQHDLDSVAHDLDRAAGRRTSRRGWD